jgi:hypothetical protein
MNFADLPHRRELRTLLDSNSKIPSRLVEALMASDDPEAQADAYFCLSEQWDRIKPELELVWTAPFVCNYLFGRITQPVERIDEESNALNSYEAASALLGILLNSLQQTEQPSLVRDLITRVDGTFLAGSETVRDCLETGFLEHALEYPDLRPLFAHWAARPEFREAHARALAWGRAHERAR